MKRKLLICCICIFSLLSFSLPSKGESMVKDKRKEIYATTEDILLNLIKPKVNNIVMNEVGHSHVYWEYAKVIEVKLILQHKEEKTTPWYEVKLLLRTNDVKNKKKWEFDSITLKVAPPYLLALDRHKKVKENYLSETSVELLEFTHHHLQK